MTKYKVKNYNFYGDGDRKYIEDGFSYGYFEYASLKVNVVDKDNPNNKHIFKFNNIITFTEMSSYVDEEEIDSEQCRTDYDEETYIADEDYVIDYVSVDTIAGRSFSDREPTDEEVFYILAQIPHW